MMLWRVPAGIEFVNFSTDIFTGLEAHHDELAILRRVQDRAERRVPLRYLFDVVYVAFHGFSYSIGDTPNEPRYAASRATERCSWALPRREPCRIE
jgi:hypothetical protein